MIKLIASDIDGTLVPDGTDKIDPEMMDVIAGLKEKGIVFAGASGRQFLSMKKLFSPVWQDIYYITDNGSILRDAKTVLKKHVIPRPLLMEMIRDAKMLPGCDIMLCGEDAAYCEEYSEMISKSEDFLKKLGFTSYEYAGWEDILYWSNVANDKFMFGNGYEMSTLQKCEMDGHIVRFAIPYENTDMLPYYELQMDEYLDSGDAFTPLTYATVFVNKNGYC